MIDKTLLYIDYLKLLDVIKKYSSTPFADDCISGLRPLASVSEIEKRQDEIDAVSDLLKWSGLAPLTDVPDIRDLLRQLAIENSVLEISDFVMLSAFLARCKEIANYLRAAFDRKPYIETLLQRMHPLQQASGQIRKAVNMDGFIEDTASYELSKIRADLFQIRERVKRHLEKMMESEELRPALQDNYVAIRNGRYVVPLKPNFNQFFQGIVHDYSHSLKTSFVEPMATVEQNNQISILEEEEKEEEKRILRELTASIRTARTELQENLEALTDLDFLHTLALFSRAHQCVRPAMVSDGTLEIRQARNPFIVMSKREKAVPIDIVMESDKSAMIISGPNAGGKTVALKTLGLLVAMASSGLFIPARETPRVALFSRLFAVIGDEQDISMELSSFTAHITAIKEVYERSQGGELILIDEIGGGTEPQEASALSMGIIDAFVEKGCKTVVTTHLNLLKAYGYSHAFAVNVATDYDHKTTKPLYSLIYGMAGVSNALHVAESCHLPPGIVEKSYRYLDKQEYMLNDLVRGLEEERKKLEEERARLGRLREETRARLKVLKEQRDALLRAAEERCGRRVAEVEQELEEIRKEALKKEKSSIKGARERIRILREKTPGAEPAQMVRVGERVRVKSLGREGYVVDVDEEKRVAEVDLGSMKMKVQADYLMRLPEASKAREKPVEVHVAPVEVPEINVRGLRVEEALREVDRFVDRAIVYGMPTVRIIHGIGTGRLMDAIKHRLAETPHIERFRRDERNSGVTIVELQ
jgi:DNA mismatch repair protein MutS2